MGQTANGEHCHAANIGFLFFHFLQQVSDMCARFHDLEPAGFVQKLMTEHLQQEVIGFVLRRQAVEQHAPPRHRSILLSRNFHLVDYLPQGANNVG